MRISTHIARCAVVFLTISGTLAHELVSPRSLDAQCSLSDAWPTGPGTLNQPQPVQAELRQILSQMDPKRINAIITKLVSFGTRHTLSNQTDPVRGIGAARDWLAAEMRTLAKGARRGTNVTITTPSFIQQPANRIPFPVNVTNVIATITGSDEPERVYIITGHYDSRVTDVNNFTDDAPGADDDASGVAIVLEIIRILSQRAPPRATVMLGAVAGEEQGLFGSTFFAQQMAAGGVDVPGKGGVSASGGAARDSSCKGGLYADDLIMYEGNVLRAQATCERLEKWATKWGTQLGIPKCGVMLWSTNEEEIRAYDSTSFTTPA